mmetsp:Transcript_4257/g.13481  ORF Transcript_4257/g.13481 Transcript_4257/m.13481 type:complete len:903 (-) Transcript_4257:80-2788(-)
MAGEQQQGQQGRQLQQPQQLGDGALEPWASPQPHRAPPPALPPAPPAHQPLSFFNPDNFDDDALLRHDLDDAAFEQHGISEIDSDQTLTERERVAKREERLERNREIARNCRKRKREHLNQLNLRIEALENENAKLRLELKLGGDQKGDFTGPAEEQQLIQDMVELVRKSQDEAAAAGVDQRATKRGALAPPRSDTEIALRRKITGYMQRHQDHGRDRQKAIGFILNRLQRLVEPENITKLYLHMMTSRDGLESAELVGLKEELQLTPGQWADFTRRARYARRLRTELDCAFEKMGSIVRRCRNNKKVGDSLNELTNILKREQFARFVVWVHSNPACKDILDELWGKLLAQCDQHINKEISLNASAVRQIKRFQENSAALSIRLFSVADPRARENIAKLCVHPDVVLVDANNNVDKRGIKAVSRYMSYVTHAFDTQSCEKTKALRALDVEERSIKSDEQDDKVTGSWRLSGVYIGRLRPRRKDSTRDSPTTPAPFGLAGMVNVPLAGFSLPSSVTTAQVGAASGMMHGVSPSGRAAYRHHVPFAGHADGSPSSRSPGSGAPEPLLSKEEQRERTVTFNVIVEFSFADPVRPELITEMIVSWDAMSLLNQLKVLHSPAPGVLPPPNARRELPGIDALASLPVAGHGEDPAVAPREAAAAAPIPAVATGGQAPEVPAAIGGPEAAPCGDAAVPGSAGDDSSAEEPAANQDEHAVAGEGPVQHILPAVARRHAVRLAELFHAEGAAAELIATEILEPRCVFDDIHMGAKYKGIPASLKYIRRLRRAFPKFEISVSILSEKKLYPERSARRRAGSRGSVVSDPSSPHPGGSPLSPLCGGAPGQFELKWEVSGFYNGALVSSPRPCQINGRVFVTTSPTTDRVLDAKFDLVAPSLMHQLGLLSTLHA